MPVQIQMQSSSRPSSSLILLLFIALALTLSLSITAVVTAAPAYAAPLKQIRGTEFIDMVKSSSKDKKVIVVFASWCGHCRSLIPKVTTLAGSEQSTSFHLLSIDEDPAQIENFASAVPGELPIYSVSSKMDIMRIFYALSIDYQNTIPHITILNSENKPIFNDGGDIGTIRNIIK